MPFSPVFLNPLFIFYLFIYLLSLFFLPVKGHTEPADTPPPPPLHVIHKMMRGWWQFAWTRKLTAFSSSSYCRQQKNYSVNLDIFTAVAEESYSSLGSVTPASYLQQSVC
jgi:hypothetical protein